MLRLFGTAYNGPWFVVVRSQRLTLPLSVNEQK
jgi:hypothetical protein